MQKKLSLIQNYLGIELSYTQPGLLKLPFKRWLHFDWLRQFVCDFHMFIEKSLAIGHLYSDRYRHLGFMIIKKTGLLKLL